MSAKAQPAGPESRNRYEPLAVVSLALVALMAAALYGRALDFAYFNDDPTGHFAWMEGKTTADFFRSSADYGYYRPVVFTTLRATETLFGGHVPQADHALLLLLHGANAAMVWLLAYRLAGRQLAYAWVATLAFIAMPFNYEAVTYVASLTHPLLLFWLLLTLHLYIWGRTAGRRLPLVAAWLTLVLALLTHENGLLILPALAGVEWALFRPAGWRDWLRPLWSYVLPVAIYIPLWLIIPKDSEAAFSLAAAGRNAVPFLQSLVFPLLPLLRLAASDTGALALAALLFLGITAVLAWRSGAGRLWVFAAGWVALSVMPALLFLSPDYLYGSPRLSYLPAVGVGLLWGLPVLWLWRGRLWETTTGPVWQAARLGISAGMALAIVIPPLPFVRCQLDFYAAASAIAREMATSAAAAPDGEPLALVNVPFFFSSNATHPDGCPSPYPWTPVGAVVMPPYAHARDFVRFNGGPDRPVAAVHYDGYAPGWATAGVTIGDEELRGLVAGGSVRVFDLLGNEFVDLNARWQPGGAASGTPQATFGGALDLLAGEIHADEAGVTARLNWQVVEPPPAPLAVFVHLYAPDGTLLAQSDAPPGQGLVPVALWQAGDLITDTARLAVAESELPPAGDLINDSARLVVAVSELPPGSYAVRAGVYDPLTGERLPALAGDRPVPDNAVTIGRIER